jgi:molybdopterin/thiamine biosynthesis adenylyltransferase
MMWGYSDEQLQLLLLIGIVFAVLIYLRFLSKMRKKSAVIAAPETQTSNQMSDTELDRYARHLVLREIGGQGQKKLRAARVLVVGAGGLGSPVLQYLAAAGVGTIGVIDDDIVSNSNLQRQVLFGECDLDLPMVFAAAKRLRDLNPYVDVLPYNRRLTDDVAAELIADFDLVLDGCDNFETRALVNETCVAVGVPLLSGAITQWEGQVALFNASDDAPCYACVFPKEPGDGLAPSCAEAGVVGALPGVVGSIMAAETIKWITGAGASLSGKMMIYDALWGETRMMKLTKSKTCVVCGQAEP